MKFRKQFVDLCNSIALDQIYTSIKDLTNEYPDFQKWYFEKVLSQLNSYRKILAVFEKENLAGILITKDQEEKKICTLRVEEQYRGQGIGSFLMKRSMEILQCQKPLITVSESHLFQFQPLFEKYKFKKVCHYKSYYKKNRREYSFNGYLNNDGFTNKEKIV